MKSPHKHQHFLVYTFEHLFGVFFVFTIALLLGYVASAQTALPNSTSTPATFVPPPPTLSYNGNVGNQLNFGFTATDNVRIAGYQLFKNDMQVTTFAPTQTNYTDPNVVPGTTYRFYAKAFDGATPPNISLQGNVVYVTIPQTTATPPPPPAPTPTGTVVSFTVTKAPVTDCSSGKPMTEVFFAISDLLGGKFQVSPDGGLTHVFIDWGKHMLPNGTYQWKGIVNAGYIADGISSDTFLLMGECLTAVTPSGSTSPTPASVTTTTAPPPPSSTNTNTNTATPAPLPVTQTQNPIRPTLHMFVDDMPITKTAPVFNNEHIELRVMTPHAKKVNFYAMVPNSTTPLTLGVGVVDDLLSNQDYSAWTYIWEATKAKESSYKVFARILRLDGTQVETPPVLLSISHQTTEEETPVSDSSGISNMSDSERTEILTRVTDPTECTSALECKVYCESHPSEHRRCVEFARANLSTDTLSTPSLTDNIPIERLINMLSDQHKRSKDIPELVQSVTDLKAYCADPVNIKICTDALLHNDLATADSLAAKKVELENSRNNEEKLLTERSGVRAFVDTDADGISDYDEVNIYHTDPNDPDTDHDGVPDGKEIESHTNPNGQALRAPRAAELNSSSTLKTESSSAGEDVVLENPLLAGVTKKEILSVSGVTALVNETKNEDTKGEIKLKFSGKSLPNSYVSIFIFSDPIVVTIKTDPSGAWTYTLDKNLPDGSHQVMTAITDGGGRILAKSEPLPFVKQAAAVSVGSDTLVPTQVVPGFFSGPSLYAFIAILVGLVGAAFSVIGFISYRRKDDMPLT